MGGSNLGMGFASLLLFVKVIHNFHIEGMRFVPLMPPASTTPPAVQSATLIIGLTAPLTKKHSAGDCRREQFGAHHGRLRGWRSAVSKQAAALSPQAHPARKGEGGTAR